MCASMVLSCVSAYLARCCSHVKQSPGLFRCPTLNDHLHAYALSEMSYAQYFARHQDLLARVDAAPADVATLRGLMQEYETLTQDLNAEPTLAGNVRMHRLNARLLSELLGKLARAIVAASNAMRG